MSKELNKAPAEQAGGDERAAFEAYRDRRNALLESEGCKPGSKWHITNAHYPTWEASRAALAQPSPVRSSLLINGYQLRDALEFIAPDGTAEQLESEARIEWRQQDADFLEAGLYAWCAEYPEEGCVLLDEEPATAQPSPAQAEQAEAERPEVVAYADPIAFATFKKRGHEGGVAGREWMWAEPSAGLVAMSRTDECECIIGELRSERDAALARVAELESKLAELEKQEPVGCRMSRSALTEAQMRRIYENSTEIENERLGFAAFARLMRRAEAVHQIAAAPGKEGV